ncbi:LacI family DNA-binding transcriptional regulator [Kutzneria kofuensis]|uniref:DNA-binding LacI/PurR family transcriptional regulator n=1 Tax=Kutzneria kofuensis TaxID=103725 RepID=A0A7W9KL70_9PSEU|nr:LacI family DNA-binding transcriptional regulator [Kutzneria kofuensis]MBB5894613.1 DNA-binding LacI/PurR family transcriptional regulator [Kutzneria kofuensis]
MKRPTIMDIARRAGVSKGAVSMALNGLPGVSEATRSRILEVARELDWHPNNAARALSAARADAIGLVLARPARTLGVEPFFFQLISGLQAELSGRRIALLLQVVEDLDAEIAVYRQWWSERRVDAVFLIDLRVEDPRVELMEELDLPAMVIGGPGHHGRLPSVWADDAKAMTRIVDHLAGLGHRRIARIAGLPDLLHTERRTEAFRAAAHSHGIDAAPILMTDYSGEQGAAATRRLLRSPQPPTAIVYDNDVMAVAGVAVATELGVAVPASLSIVAWDDSPLCQLLHPPLTALTRDTFAFGASAARSLLAVLDGGEGADVEDHVPILVHRESTSAPSA